MENASKRKFISRESYQPQYNYNNQKLLVDNATNTECLKPMMLNAWTQTDGEDFRFKPSQNLVDNLQERIRKLEEMFQMQSIALNENQTNQVSNTSTTNCINGKTIQNHLSNKRSPSKSRHPEKTTYKIVAGPAGMEIIEPIEVEYAEEDGTYLDHDLNTSNDSNRLEICIPKEEYTTNNDQQQHNIEHISQQQQQQQSNLQTYSIQDYEHQQPTNLQQQQHQTIQLQTSSGQHIQTIPTVHNSHPSSQLYHTQISDNYHTITQTQSQPQQQQQQPQHQHQQQSQQDNNIKNLQYISVVHPNINGSSNGHVQQPQNVIISTQHTQQSSISPMSTSSTKSSQRHRLKSDVRYYMSQESLHSCNSAPEISNEVTVPAVSSSFAEIKKEFINRDESNDSRRSNIGSNFPAQQLNDIEVSLGPNNTRISAAVYESIDWTSVTSATRKLLITIFDRETLATHTMTGKPSPAFKGRDLPSKHQLNPQAVQDIIFAVSRKCNVAEKEVRTAITTKCADENKMLKQREKKRRSLQESNKENLSKNEVISGH